MKQLQLLAFAIFIISNTLSAQQLQVDLVNGLNYTYMEATPPYSKEHVQDNVYWKFSYKHQIKPQFKLGLSFSYTQPFIGFHIGDYPFSNLISEANTTFGYFLNLGLSFSYDWHLSRRWIFSPEVGLWASQYRAIPGQTQGTLLEYPFYGQVHLKGAYRIDSYQGFQFRPEASVGLEWLFLKYFSLQTRIGFILGTKRIQEMTVDYTLENYDQVFRAKNYTNGTLWYPSIGLSFYFGGYKIPKKKGCKRRCCCDKDERP